MKKIGILAALLVVLLLTACTDRAAGEETTPTTPPTEAVTTAAPETETTAPPTDPPTEAPTEEPTEAPQEAAYSYTVPDGWVKAGEQMGMTFYTEDGHENDAMPDNIAVSVGENLYALEDHETFKAAVQQIIGMQMGDDSSVKVYADGFTTEQELIGYRFVIEDSDAVTVQYYILKDYGFCLVQLTNFTGASAPDEAAQSIVDSFVWEEA